MPPCFGSSSAAAGNALRASAMAAVNRRLYLGDLSASCVLRDAPCRALLGMRDVVDGPKNSRILRRPRSGRLEGRATPIRSILNFLTAAICRAIQSPDPD